LKSVTGDGLNVFTKESLEMALWAYGAERAAEAVRTGLKRVQVQAIGRRAAELIFEPDPSTKSGAGYAFERVLALAAIQVPEGHDRQLARMRRRSRQT